MSTIFEDLPAYPGIRGDRAKVTHLEGRVLIRAADTMAAEAVTIAMTPEQAAALSMAIYKASQAAADDQDA